MPANADAVSGDFRRLIDKTHFSMAQQDVRYYLNGLLLETDGKLSRRARMDIAWPFARQNCNQSQNESAGHSAAQGCARASTNSGRDGNVDLAIGTSHVRAQIGDIRFTSKLIDGRFRSMARYSANPTNRSSGPEGLRQALQRTAILSNEKYRGVRINLKSDLVTIQAHNPEQRKLRIKLRSPTRATRWRSASMSLSARRVAAVDSEKLCSA
jgi:DNA polymerase-3 subunit beta